MEHGPGCDLHPGYRYRSDWGLIVAAQTRLFGDFNAAVAGGNGRQIAGEYS